MRPLIAAVILTLASLPAIAQTAGPQGGGATITREQFVSRAADLAGRRFDMIDTSHTGTITRTQLREFRRNARPANTQ